MGWNLRIPYGDCDQQGIVFNAKYLAYVDDCVDVWWADTFGDGYLGEWEAMVKKATVEWSSPARYRDVLECTPSVERWGRTSFDVRVDGHVGDRQVFRATLVYVAVAAGSHEPIPVPEVVRARWSSDSTPAPT